MHAEFCGRVVRTGDYKANKGEAKTQNPPKLDKDTEELFVAMDIHTGDNVKKSDHQPSKKPERTTPEEAQSKPGATASVGTVTNNN